MVKKLQQKLSKDANLKELLSGSAITFVIKITGMLIGYIVILIISRKYGAEGTGVYSIATNLINTLAILGGVGLNISVLRYVGQFNNESQENGQGNMKALLKIILEIALPFSIILGVLLFFFAEKIALKVFENSTYIIGLKVASISLPFFTIYLINLEFIRGLKLLRISEFLRSISRHVVVLLLLLSSILSFGILDSIYAMVTGIIVSFALSFIFLWRFFNRNTKSSKADISKKQVLKTSLPMMVTSVASFTLGNAASFFLETYGSTDEVGIFNVCLRLSQLVGLALIVVNTISAPKFAELYWAGKMVELRKLISQSSKLIFYASSGVAIFICTFSKFILNIFGNEFSSGIWVLFILIAGQLINSFTGSVGVFLNMSGNEKVLRNIVFASTLFVLVSYYFLIPVLGMVGAAIVSFMGSLLLNISAVIYAYKKTKIITFYIPYYKSQ